VIRRAPGEANSQSHSIFSDAPDYLDQEGSHGGELLSERSKQSD
jgi:hypothetical protein